MPKFGCIQNHITRFVREYRIPGVENKRCSAELHEMRIGEDTYVYNGEPQGLKSVFCSDLECFLQNLDRTSVARYIESASKGGSKK